MIRRGSIIRTTKKFTIFRCKVNKKFYSIPNDVLVITNERENNMTGFTTITVDIPEYIYNK